MTNTNNTTDLVRDNTDNLGNATIPTLTTTAGTTPESLETNTWGYKKDSGNFIPFVNNTRLLENTEATNEDSTTLTFASKIDYSQIAGRYAATLAFVGVTNPQTYYIQDLDPTLCTSSEPLVVIDKRDNQEYTIQRLNDGRCWMTQNLKLGKTTSTLALSSENSDIESDFTLNGRLSDGKFTSSVVDGTESQNNSSQYYCTENYGCYYNWYTATAGSGTTTMTANNAGYSICPAGWSLPPQKIFNNLLSLNGGAGTSAAAAAITVNPSTATENVNGMSAPGFLLSGFYNTNGAYNVGSIGYYWSANSATARDSKYLYISSTAQVPNDGRKFLGMAMRCFMDERTIDDLEYLQDFYSMSSIKQKEVVAAMPEETVYTLKDNRDEKTYTIAKLKDGQVWMTSDLNLAGATSLYSSTSNVPPGYDLTAYYTLPNSSSSGFSSDTTAYVYNSGNITTSQSDCTASKKCNSYYSWRAATAGNQTGVSGNGVDVPYSICPAGWRLPKSGNQDDTSATSATGYKKGDFYKLATAYGVDLESLYYQDSAVFYQNAGPGTVPNFLLAGRFTNGSFLDGGSYGNYWSSSSYDGSGNAYRIRFGNSTVNVATAYNLRCGFSVRCLLNN